MSISFLFQTLILYPNPNHQFLAYLVSEWTATSCETHGLKLVKQNIKLFSTSVWADTSDKVNKEEILEIKEVIWNS